MACFGAQITLKVRHKHQKNHSDVRRGSIGSSVGDLRREDLKMNRRLKDRLSTVYFSLMISIESVRYLR